MEGEEGRKRDGCEKVEEEEGDDEGSEGEEVGGRREEHITVGGRL